MANKTKKTIKEMYEEILANPTLTEEQVKFLKGRIEIASKKSGGEKKPTATQIANEGLRAEILASMEIGAKYQINDMIKTFHCCAELSNQKVSAVIRPLIPDSITKVVEGRTTYFVRNA